MIGLDRLIKRNGVIAAGQFDSNGKAIRKAGDLSDEMANMISKMCLKNNQIFEEQINEFSEKSDMDWKPLAGWTVWGGKYSVCVVGNTGVFVETSKADFNQLMVDLIDDNPTGAKQSNY